MKPISKVLIANRGEIAVRLIRAARSLSLRTVSVFSTPDRYAPHTVLADEAVHIGAAPSGSSYLHAPALLAAARASVHAPRVMHSSGPWTAAVSTTTRWIRLATRRRQRRTSPPPPRMAADP